MAENNLFKEVVTKNIVSVSDGRLKILETMDITMYGSKAWAFTLQKIGERKNKEFLFDLGLLMGNDSVKEIKDLFKKKKSLLSNKIQQPDNIIQLLGFGRVKIENNEKKFIVKIDKNHIMDYGKELYGEKSMIPYFYAGIYTAFLKEFYKLKEKLNIKKTGDKIFFYN